MNPSAILTLYWHESQQRLVKAKILKAVTSAASLPPGMGLSQRPRMSNAWDVIQPQTLDKLKMCQESTNVPASAHCSLEIRFFLAGGKDSRERSQGVLPQPTGAGSSPITGCILVPLPQQPARSSPCVSGSLEIHSKKGVFPRAWIQPCPCSSL